MTDTRTVGGEITPRFLHVDILERHIEAADRNPNGAFALAAAEALGGGWTAECREHLEGVEVRLVHRNGEERLYADLDEVFMAALYDAGGPWTCAAILTRIA